jgi:hypothetical protein
VTDDTITSKSTQQELWAEVQRLQAIRATLLRDRAQAGHDVDELLTVTQAESTQLRITFGVTQPSDMPGAAPAGQPVVVVDTAGGGQEVQSVYTPQHARRIAADMVKCAAEAERSAKAWRKRAGGLQ